MRYATGRHMCHSRFNHGYDVADVEGMIRLVFAGARGLPSKGEATLAPGIEPPPHRRAHGRHAMRAGAHEARLGGASPPTPATTTSTSRPAAASARSSTWARRSRATIRCARLAESPRHIVPGHDPLVMQRYPGGERGAGRRCRAAGCGAGSWRLTTTDAPHGRLEAMEGAGPGASGYHDGAGRVRCNDAGSAASAPHSRGTTPGVGRRGRLRPLRLDHRLGADHPPFCTRAGRAGGVGALVRRRPCRRSTRPLWPQERPSTASTSMTTAGRRFTRAQWWCR